MAVRDLCARAGVLFFHKQNGGRNKKASGRRLGGKEYSAMPAVPERAVPSAKVRRELARWLVPEGFAMVTTPLCRQEPV